MMLIDVGRTISKSDRVLNHGLSDSKYFITANLDHRQSRLNVGIGIQTCHRN